MAINKVIDKNGATVIDISQDTLTSDTTKVIAGFTYHGNDGVQYTGTAKAGGGIPGGYNITLVVDGTPWQALSVAQGGSVRALTNPVKSGYVFAGWATESGATMPDITLPFTPLSDATLYAVFNTVTQYRAAPTGYGSSSPSSVSFGSNSNLLNWTPEQVTKDGNVFLKFPTFYRKAVASASGQLTSFIVSSWKEDDNFEPYPCFLDESGNILPYILVGKYRSSSAAGTNLNSVAGATAVTRTIADGRTWSRSLGTGYQQWDWMIHKLWQDLICAKMQTININSDSGITTDALGLRWDQNGTWVDGITHYGVGKKFYISYHPSKYTSEAGATTQGYVDAGVTYSGTSGQEISKLNYNTDHPFANLPAATVDNSSFKTYYCDAFYFGTSGTNPVRGLVGFATASVGAFSWSADYPWTNADGVRLCYRPLSE